MKVCTVDEIGKLDRRAIEEFGVPGSVLMENAGEAVYYAILQEIGVEEISFVVVCGLGNNGGDGFVVARKLQSSGAYVLTLVLGEPDSYRESARMYYDMLLESGAEIVLNPSTDEVADALMDADVVVDAIFGSGLARDVEGRFQEVIELINNLGEVVYSVDIPSGVDGNRGAVRGVAVEADATITFGLPKRGNLLYPGAGLGGHLYVSHISYPPQLTAAPDIKVEVLEPSELPPRREDGHKGSFGDVLFVAGAQSYFGAPAFAALSHLKAGGGYSRLAAPASVIPSIAPMAGEVVYAPQKETERGSLAMAALDDLLALAEEVDFVVLGPGLSLAEETQELARALAAGIQRPLLIDGDGLTAVAEDTGVIKGRTAPTILTPHPGEMSRLADVSIPEVLEDPIGILQRVTEELGAMVVLKGAHSLVGLSHGRVYVNTSGNSGMATAGSGDVLTGTISAMFGLGLPLGEAVTTGVFMHGFAGDLAAEELGPDGMTARDVLELLPEAVATYREEFEEIAESYYGAIELL